MRFPTFTFVNKEYGNGDLMGDVNWLLCNFWGKGRRSEKGVRGKGRGSPVLDHPLGFRREKALAYSSF